MYHFPCVTVKNLGVTLDCLLTMKTHISSLVHSANFELRHISFFYRLLSTDATEVIVSAFVLSHLDYCISLLSGCPQYLLNCKKFKSMLLALPWEFPKLTICHLILLPSTGCPLNTVQTRFFVLNCLSSTAPVYLTELLKFYKPTCQLCSSFNTFILCLPSVCTLAWSEIFFLHCVVCLEQTPLQS